MFCHNELIVVPKKRYTYPKGGGFMTKRYRGRVKSFNKDRGYGFIASQNNQIGDVFLFWNELRVEGFKTVDVDETVEFSVEQREKGTYAIDVDIVKRNRAKYNTENKLAWYREGERLEESFVREIVPKIPRKLIIHPNKLKNPHSIDLYNPITKEEADLKTQQTPFFTSEFVGYKLDPQYTVTFNKKDYMRYKELYPNILIYFYVNWQQLSYNGLSVEPLEGLWEVPFKEIQKAIENGEVYLHQYHNRKQDDVNARDSYLFDLNNFTRLL